MSKVKVVLAYDGSFFNGFAIQKEEKNTVSQKLYEAFKSVGIYSRFNASGRTDKGVHALYQVLDIDLPPFWSDLERLKKELNRKLKPSIMIKCIDDIADDFHARYSAKKRVYRYIITKEKYNIFKSRYITFVDYFDEEEIKKAVKLFEGRHDFKNFKKEHGGSKTSVRTIYKARFYGYRDIYVFYFEADGFLRSQIRMMVDFLLKVGDGRLSCDELRLQLECDKVFLRTLAPACGLYLSKVKY